tara:strand:- start:9288 stop:9716 length:429 start_codon:yes stop_codon:yes gene_type:complete
MPRYLIQNNSKNPVRIAGVLTLAVVSYNRNGSAWISEDIFSSQDVQSKLSNGSLKLLETVGETPPPPPEPAPVVEPEVETVPVEPETVEPETAEPEVVSDDEAMLDYTEMKFKALKDLAIERGLDVKGLRKKQQLIDLLSGS